LFNDNKGEKMKTIVFYSSKNSKGRKDATGAFIPEALAFAKFHNIPNDQLFGIDCVTQSKDVRRKLVYDSIHQLGSIGDPIDAIAFFGHGWPDGIQFGITRKNITDFSALLRQCCTTNVVVALYACLTADNDIKGVSVDKPGPGTDGGFADLLRDALSHEGIFGGHVDAHATAGHATMNPFVVRFRCLSSERGIGGNWLVAPQSKNWKKWNASVHNEKDTLRFRFPFMGVVAIEEELNSRGIIPAIKRLLRR
jgi:hypothetical protein